MKIKLERPLIFFDLETTGTDIKKDRIVEISVLKVYPDREEPVERVVRVNPGMPIPAEATAVHHITDDDVRDKPSFESIAQAIADSFKGCDIAGFNSNKFDLPLLCEEMARARVPFSVLDVNLIDVQNIYHKKEPRNLSAAYRFYCGKELENAHSASSDTRATYEVFVSQLEKYDDLPATVEELAEFARFNRNIDLSGFFIRNDKNQEVINFGKHKGKTVAELCRANKPDALSYLSWVMEGSFPIDTQMVAKRLREKYQ